MAGNEEQFVVEKILKKRYSRRGLEYLVKWLGFDESENSWNLEEDLNCKQLIADFEQTYVDSNDQLDDIEVGSDEKEKEEPQILKLPTSNVSPKLRDQKPQKRSLNPKEESLTKRKKEKKLKDKAGNTLYEVEKIVDSRIQDRTIEYEIKWKGYKKTSWEPEESLLYCKDLVAEFDRIKKQELTHKTIFKKESSLPSTMCDDKHPQSNEDFLNLVRDKLQRMNSFELANAKKKILETLCGTHFNK